MTKKPTAPKSVAKAKPPSHRYKSPTGERNVSGLSSEEVTSLPRSLVAALPTATVVMHHVNEIKKLIPQIEKELAAARLAGPVTLARAYVVLHKMGERIQERMQISDSGKAFGPTIQQYKTVEIPAAFEQAGVPHVSLDEGFRVGVSMTFRASIKPDQKPAAYAWLRANGLPDIITETVNASTLSAAAKKEIETNNREFPDDLFNIATVPNVSVTAK